MSEEPYLYETLVLVLFRRQQLPPSHQKCKIMGVWEPGIQWNSTPLPPHRPLYKFALFGLHLTRSIVNADFSCICPRGFGPSFQGSKYHFTLKDYGSSLLGKPQSFIDPQFIAFLYRSHSEHLVRNGVHKQYVFENISLCWLITKSF